MNHIVSVIFYGKLHRLNSFFQFVLTMASLTDSSIAKDSILVAYSPYALAVRNRSKAEDTKQSLTLAATTLLNKGRIVLNSGKLFSPTDHGRDMV